MREKINMLIHSEPKSGKTTFAVRRNPNALILDTEGSSKHIKGCNREVITSFYQMDSVLKRIRKGEINVVVIDTLDELVNNFAKNDIKRMGGSYVQSNGMLTMQGWGIMRDKFMTLSRSFRDAGADVVTLCHSELVEKPDGSKKWTMKLPSDYAREIMGMMDIVGFMEKKSLPDGKNIFTIHFDKTEQYDAGIRAVYDVEKDEFRSPIEVKIENPALVDILKSYDDFFEGEGEGFIQKTKQEMDIEKQVEEIMACKTMEELEKTFLASKVKEGAVENAKNEMKAKLSDKKEE